MDVLKWLENWYNENCNGDWEHGYGIKISTLDNPGWYVEINLVDTELEDRSFNNFQIERSDNDWLHCKVKDGVYIGAGGTFNLIEILNTFRDWAVH